MIKKPEQIIQEQMNPSQSRGGFGGLLDYARERNENTGLSRMQNFAAALDPLIMPEMRAGEGIRERGMQRVAAGNKNKTIEMLIAKDRQDLADMVRNGSLDIKTAMSILLTPQKQQAGIAVGNNIINPVTGEVIYEGTGGGDVDVTKRSALRKEFTSLQKIKDFSKVSDAYTRVVESSRNPSAAGDLALIFNYMKVLDPGSTVREGEFATAQNAAGVGGRVVSLYNSIIRGERLNVDQRADFVDRSTRLYKGAENQTKPLYDFYKNLAVERGYDPDLILPSFSFVGDFPVNPNIKPASFTGTQEEWKQMNAVERAPFLE